MTISGKRMPILTLTQTELPRLLEFYDYRARRGDDLLLLFQADQSRAALEALPAAAFAGGAVLGVNASSVGLIRGVAQFRANPGSAADVVFVMDKSIDSLALTSEMLSRLIASARASGVARLNVTAQQSSTLLSALRSCGWPMQDGDSGMHWILNISGDGLPRQERGPAVGTDAQNVPAAAGSTRG